MLRKFVVVGLVLLTAGLAPGSSAQKGASSGEVLFGSQSVAFRVDKDVIRVGSQIGKFDRVRLHVLDNDVKFKDVKVVYEDGSATDVPVNENVKANTRTKWFSVRSNKFIKEIQLTYQSNLSAKGEAQVAVYGEYAEGWLKPGGEGSKYNKGWVLLGSDLAGFVGFTNRTFSVGKNEGGFRALRVTARNRAITLRQVTVTYADGKTETFRMRERVDADQSQGPIDLKGARPRIREVGARYRSRFFDSDAKSGAARVEIWGQH